jgi:hypothetical protein
MNFYYITLNYEYFTINTCVDADTEEEAKRRALGLLDTQGINLGTPPYGYEVELEGSYSDV